MKKGILGVVTFLLSLCFVAQAFAFSPTDRVTIAPNGEGNLLFFPAYFTGGGWENEITLINTSQTDSIVVHVGVRRALDSAERDFFVFLSPTDVFRMIIKQNAQGVPVVESDDSSMVIKTDCTTAADYAAQNGQSYQLELLDNNGNGGWEMGYVAAVVVAQANLGAPPVNKLTICTNYINNAMGNLLPAGAWNVPGNVLTGIIETYNTQTNVRGIIKAFALKDYNNNYGAAFGQTLNVGTRANNSRQEVDAVLANDLVVVPYIGLPNGQTLYTATFPTGSGAYVGRVFNYNVYDTEEHIQPTTNNAFSPPPNQNIQMMEMTPIIFSQNISGTQPIDRGWILVDYTGSIAGGIAADGVSAVTINDGVPAIHTVMHTILGANTIQGVGWFYAPSQMGNILYNNAPVSHYAPVNIPNPPCAPTAGFCNY